jgi:exopolyphosphatase / guanosine-5'-triphosphate,3'-diphosphate pyrophosphatase
MTPRRKFRIASIDVGTNSILLAISEFYPDGRFKILKEDIQVPRIGAGLSARCGKISSSSIAKLIKALRKFKAICYKFNVDKTIIVGTEALRRASNSSVVIKAVEKKLSLKIEVIDPRREAALSYLSATKELSRNSLNKAVVLDIGAGSTEISAMFGAGKLEARSIRIGALKIQEKFDIRHPVNKITLAKVEKFIRERVAVFKSRKRDFLFLGTGGTITTVPAILKGLDKYNDRQIDLKKVTFRQIRSLIIKLAGLNSEQLKKVKGMPATGRADIFLAGLVILQETMRVLKTTSILVRNRGLRYGILFDTARKEFL